VAAKFDRQSILLVEDEAFSRSLVSQMLRRIGFGDVLMADNGDMAIDILNSRKVTIVLSDFRMPGMHGLGLLQNIRIGATKAQRGLPFAMLTSYADRNLVGLAIVLDINSFLAKPASPEALTKRLTHCLQNPLEALPVETYAAVSVESVAPPAPAAPPPGDSRKSPSVVLTAKSGPATDNRKVVRVALNEVPENAVLARNLMGSSGQLLLGAGTHFRARYIKRLEELTAIDEKIEHVYVYE
jgi:two-component system, chemotaxis family, chemotaxis protein CheY